MRLNICGLIACCGLASSVSLLHAEPFVFQGQLNDNGAAADGLFDLEFSLFDSALNGLQLGSTLSFDDVMVESGVFSVELDFGSGMFDGSTRWVEIGVRPGATMDAFTALTPRAKVGNAPQSNYASRAGVADTLSDPFWTQAPGILFFGEDEGSDKVFINRDRVVENSDVFVVHSAMNGFGGMTLSNWAGGMPYYGYATGGFSRVKTYYDPVTDAWVVNKGGDQLEIDSNNDVIITNNLIVGGTITAMGGGSGGGTITGYKAYTPDSIYQNFDFTRAFNSFAGAIVTQGTSGYLRADIDLPHGSMITNIHIEFVDRAASNNIRVQLWEREILTLLYTNETLGESTGSNLNTVQVMDIVPNPPIEIDNTLMTYGLRVFATAGTWPSAGNMGVRAIVIEYESPAP